MQPYQNKDYKSGTIILTNLRLLWLVTSISYTTGGPCHLPLTAISSHDYKKSSGILGLKPPRLKLSVRLDRNQYPTPDTPGHCIQSLRITTEDTNGLRYIYSTLSAALSSREWLTLGGGTSSGIAEITRQLYALHMTMVRTVPYTTTTNNNNVYIASNRKPPGGGGQQQHASPLKAGVEASGPLGILQPLSPLPRPSPSFTPDDDIMEDICRMGFPVHQAANAVIATNNGTAQQAVEWLVDPSHSGLRDCPNEYSPGGKLDGTVLAAMLKRTYDKSTTTATATTGGDGGLYGITAIKQEIDGKAREKEHTLNLAFTDLQGLMNRAKDMVIIAQEFKRKLLDKEGSPQGSSNSDAMDMASMLADLGMIAPVTKEASGRHYERELSRQLADYLIKNKAVEVSGGFLTLPDAYCLYNRARGTELASPDDIVAAVSLFPSIGAPFCMKVLASGVKVIQSASYTDEVVCRKIKELLVASEKAGEGGGRYNVENETRPPWLEGIGEGLTAVEAASHLSVPLPVAREQLFMAESRGVLCRDEGPEGLRFYRNFFVEAT